MTVLLGQFAVYVIVGTLVAINVWIGLAAALVVGAVGVASLVAMA